MTDTQDHNIAIAEFTGHKWYWRVSGEKDGAFTWALFLAYPPEEGIGKAWIGCSGETRAATESEIAEARMGNLRFTNHAPDYVNSLDAAHLAEAKIDDDSFYVYYRTHLSDVVRKPNDTLQQHARAFVSATAPQRSQALVRFIRQGRPPLTPGEAAAKIIKYYGKGLAVLAD